MKSLQKMILIEFKLFLRQPMAALASLPWVFSCPAYCLLHGRQRRWGWLCFIL
jgi:hypothetical protein